MRVRVQVIVEGDDETPPAVHEVTHIERGVEHNQDARARAGCVGYELSPHGQAVLQRAEIGAARLVGDDDLAIEERSDRVHVTGPNEFGEPGRQVTTVSTQHVAPSAGSAPELSAEAVEFRFVAARAVPQVGAVRAA
jgi:hypothetical protein